ncbi:PREDICTED: COP9 signalosome complex subunit 7-like [Ipomoea nil]|uniref:COP9 signalosome complex subunit 7-like n=1 Tax=Ipomoea nil TaxID=35883 RepID=UPI0009012A31|nr:PREDICTED: COP9 signalosome complex subunit 7-like [Ipomoea nil]
MDIEERQAKHIEYFVEQLSALKGSALATVVTDATSHPSLFTFSEILSVFNVLELEGAENSIYLDLLRLFAHGTWTEYKRSFENYLCKFQWRHPYFGIEPVCVDQGFETLPFVTLLLISFFYLFLGNRMVCVHF